MDISVSFIPDDVVNEARKVYKLKLTRKQASDFLSNRGDAIRESMIDSGWRSINDFLQSDYNKKVGSGIDRFIKNPGISPVWIITPLVLGAGILTYFIIKGKVKPKPAPASQSEAIQRILKFLPVGSKFWGLGNAMPTPLAQLPAGYRYSSLQGTMTEAGTLWFIIPTGG